MGLTPYPSSDDDYENPAILASHDNVTWRLPNGAPDPLENYVGTPYNSDTELVMHEGVLYCFWRRYYTSSDARLLGRTTTDGVNWTRTVEYDAGAGVHMWTSPAMWVHEGTWYAWIEHDTGPNPGDPKQIKMLTATDPEGPWSAPALCTLNGFPAGFYPWHQGVTRHGGHWWMTISDGDKLVLATSRDGLVWNCSPHVMVKGATGAWDDIIIYRPCLIIEGTNARIWYGARNVAGDWHIGYTEIPVVKFPAPPAL
jgi:hypothetical protein